jgi:hypothetical protein
MHRLGFAIVVIDLTAQQARRQPKNTADAVIPGRGHRVGAFAPPDDRLRIEPGISRFRVWCSRTIPE